MSIHPKLVARSPNSAPSHFPAPRAPQQSAPTMTHATYKEDNHCTPAAHLDSNNTPSLTNRKLIAKIPEDLLNTLRTNCANIAAASLLGRIQGKHPGLKALTTWVKETLQPSLTLLSLKSNNVFEVTFARSEGRIHAFNQADLICESAAIHFSSWRPHYDPRKPQAAYILDYPVWVQVIDFCQVLREENFLHTIGKQIGQVISIDRSDAYRAKLFGPMIRLLVKDLHTLPQLCYPDWTVKAL